MLYITSYPIFIAITLLSCRDHAYSYHSSDTQYPHTAVDDILLTVTLEIVFLCPLERKLFSSMQLNVHHVAESCTVEPLDTLGAIHKCPDNQGVSRSLHMLKHHLGPQLSVCIMQVSIFSSILISRFHCTSIL